MEMPLKIGKQKKVLKPFGSCKEMFGFEVSTIELAIINVNSFRIECSGLHIVNKKKIPEKNQKKCIL
jgi:hypothetical protein